MKYSSLRLVLLAGLSLGAVFACSDSDDSNGEAGQSDAGSSGLDDADEGGASATAGRPSASGGRASTGGGAGAGAPSSRGGTANGGSAGAENGGDAGSGPAGAPGTGGTAGSGGSGDAGASGSSGEAGAGSGEDECPAGFYGPDCAPCECETGYCDDGREGDGSCDPCPRGYTGEDCALCAPGFQDRDGNGSCLAACSDESCSGRGSCNDQLGSALCDCDVGYAGASCGRCASGYQDNDHDGSCALACGDATCNGNGECSDDTGATACACDEGYTGGACELCDDGYQDNDDDGLCAPACASDTCDAPHVCADASGAAACVCPEGYAGEDCETCAEGYFSDGNGGCAFCLEASHEPLEIESHSEIFYIWFPSALLVADLEVVLGFSGALDRVDLNSARAPEPVRLYTAGGCGGVEWDAVSIRDDGSVPLQGTCGELQSPPVYAPEGDLTTLFGTEPQSDWFLHVSNPGNDPLALTHFTVRACEAPMERAP